VEVTVAGPLASRERGNEKDEEHEDDIEPSNDGWKLVEGVDVRLFASKADKDCCDTDDKEGEYCEIEWIQFPLIVCLWVARVRGDDRFCKYCNCWTSSICCSFGPCCICHANEVAGLCGTGTAGADSVPWKDCIGGCILKGDIGWFISSSEY